MLKVALVCLFLAGCVPAGRHIPETIVLNTGTSIKHEQGDLPTKVNTLNVNITWRLK